MSDIDLSLCLYCGKPSRADVHVACSLHKSCFGKATPCSSGCPAYPMHAGNLVSHKAPEPTHDHEPSNIDLDIPPLPDSPEAPQADSETNPSENYEPLSTINHPPHYTQGVFEVIDVCVDDGLAIGLEQDLGVVGDLTDGGHGQAVELFEYGVHLIGLNLQAIA